MAQEKLPELTVGTNVYHNVTILSVSRTDVLFSGDEGMANAKLKNLDPGLQTHFRYDPAKAAAVEPQQQEPERKPLYTIAAAAPAAVVVPTNTPAPIVPPPASSTNVLASVKSAMEDAIAQVKAIINQPVQQMPATPDMQVAVYRPGWFREGATKPDFNTVDVRATQETAYGRQTYVTSDLNPGVVFLGAELEFNPMTKYFYVDRSLPKKKLTDAEMLEVNRLYRIIGKCEEKLK